MSLVMSVAEREAFLAGEHVAVLAVARDGVGPLAVPVWYRYAPGGDVEVWMDRPSVKYRAIAAAGRFALVVQTETLPYKYVSVEGPVAGAERPTRAEALAIAGRYLDAGTASSYVDGALGADSVLVRMRPARWLSNDQAKAA